MRGGIDVIETDSDGDFPLTRAEFAIAKIGGLAGAYAIVEGFFVGRGEVSEVAFAHGEFEPWEIVAGSASDKEVGGGEAFDGAEEGLWGAAQGTQEGEGAGFEGCGGAHIVVFWGGEGCGFGGGERTSPDDKFVEVTVEGVPGFGVEADVATWGWDGGEGGGVGAGAIDVEGGIGGGGIDDGEEGRCAIAREGGGAENEGFGIGGGELEPEGVVFEQGKVEGGGTIAGVEEGLGAREVGCRTQHEAERVRVFGELSPVA